MKRDIPKLNSLIWTRSYKPIIIVYLIVVLAAMVAKFIFKLSDFGFIFFILVCFVYLLFYNIMIFKIKSIAIDKENLMLIIKMGFINTRIKKIALNKNIVTFKKNVGARGTISEVLVIKSEGKVIKINSEYTGFSYLDLKEINEECNSLKYHSSNM